MQIDIRIAMVSDLSILAGESNKSYARATGTNQHSFGQIEIQCHCTLKFL